MKKYDEYKMKAEYDFSQGIRGRFYKPKKISTTLRLDDDILCILKKRASEKKIPYQTLINNLLREQCEGFQTALNNL
ncbi:CopG family antitoxin [Campylobacter helveticus]|uniref:Antitoxin n=1 Tax=Campylobacter helveticus TaxID=28898 RepID=A0ABY3L4J1_9BACT|nr:CopG family antitoxin [Campylobacter helveticus]ARE80325.1 type II toxin-antitoxin system, antitoxin, CopG family [Campylobacter helveticus]MCR2040488.1 BrnA antitoxin family protein [Campylobacter helveticus]MCR2055742.1 BrnA antitoxin family protein [Campylobacter helveticus]MCR2057569.1 BrnA antitoxin family protein [Campylobacter helveticus]MCR2061153.1 BrnA antitoxin family protein [Campylobacter helveticus]